MKFIYKFQTALIHPKTCSFNQMTKNKPQSPIPIPSLSGKAHLEISVDFPMRPGCKMREMRKSPKSRAGEHGKLVEIK